MNKNHGPALMDDSKVRLNLSRNLKRLLARRKMTQSDLARACGENPMRISTIVRGTQSCTIGVLARLAAALHVSADKLLGLKNRAEKTRRPLDAV